MNSLIDANKLINNFEDTDNDIGLHIKSDKTEYMCLNHENQINMKSLSSHDIKRVYFKYICSYIDSTQHDVSIKNGSTKTGSLE